MSRKKPRQPRSPLSEFFISKSETSRIQELRIADDIDGDHIGAKRAGLGEDKADVEGSQFLVEAKRTEKKSFALNEKVLSKIDKEALNYGKIPALVVDFPNFRFGVAQRWAVIPYPVFVEIAKDTKEEAS